MVAEYATISFSSGKHVPEEVVRAYPTLTQKVDDGYSRYSPWQSSYATAYTAKSLFELSLGLSSAKGGTIHSTMPARGSPLSESAFLPPGVVETGPSSAPPISRAAMPLKAR